MNWLLVYIKSLWSALSDFSIAMLRASTPADIAADVALGEGTGLFAPGEADALLRELHAGVLPPVIKSSSAWWKRSLRVGHTLHRQQRRTEHGICGGGVADTSKA